MNIRLMKTEDIPTIVEHEVEVFGQSLGEYMLEDAIRNDLYHYFVLEVQNEIVGYIGLWMVDENGQVMNFYIHPKHQQEGLGKILFDFGMDFFDNNHVKTISLEVRPSNIAAIHLYKKYGFIEKFRRKKYYPDGEDALYYVKELGD